MVQSTSSADSLNIYQQVIQADKAIQNKKTLAAFSPAAHFIMLTAMIVVLLAAITTLTVTSLLIPPLIVLSVITFGFVGLRAYQFRVA